MNHPKVISVEALDDVTLLVGFDNSQSKIYDVSPLLDKPAFVALKNPAVFKLATVEQGGYAVVWDDNTDLSEYELWRGGVTV